MVVKTLKKTLSKGSQIFKGLCTPAKIETVLNILGLISIIITCTVPSGSSMKITCWSALPYIVISVISVIILDALCKHGFGFISWMSVLTPIIVIIFLAYVKSLEEGEGFEDYSDDDEDFDDDEENFDDDEELFEDEEEDFGLVGDLKKKAQEAIAKAKAAQEAAKAAEQEQAPAAQEPAAQEQEPAAQENPQAPQPTKEDRINRLRKNISVLEKKLEKCSDERKQKLEKLIEKRQARLEKLENATEETEESSDNSAEAFRNFGRISL